jgi:tryptophanyl-tRNA synthetase
MAEVKQVITPWDVKGAQTSEGKPVAIDYEALIKDFGTVVLMNC